MHQSPRCGARTRAGSACQSPAVSGKRRCRMHGGAEGSGARAGNRNALKHGRYSLETIEFRRRMRELLREARELIEIVQLIRAGSWRKHTNCAFAVVDRAASLGQSSAPN